MASTDTKLTKLDFLPGFHRSLLSMPKKVNGLMETVLDFVKVNQKILEDIKSLEKKIL